MDSSRSGISGRIQDLKDALASSGSHSSASVITALTALENEAYGRPQAVPEEQKLSTGPTAGIAPGSLPGAEEPKTATPEAQPEAQAEPASAPARSEGSAVGAMTSADVGGRRPR